MQEMVFVKVVGFSDVERHALNTVFRLSSDRLKAYALWTPDAPATASLAILDGDSYEVRTDLVSGVFPPELSIIWVGDDSPVPPELTFHRPIHWQAVVQAMDRLFVPPPPDIDFDLDLTAMGGIEETAAPPNVSSKRVLIASADRDHQLYLRARLALAGHVHVDETASGSDALSMANSFAYDAVVLDTPLPDLDSWQVLKQLALVSPSIPSVIMTGEDLKLPQRARAWFAGATACVEKPVEPARLHELLQKI